MTAVLPSPSLRLTLVDPRVDAGWDRDALGFAGASFFHSSGWAKVLLNTYGFTPLYLRAQEDERTVGLLPLMEARSPLTGTRGISLPFTDDCEALCEDERVAFALWERARELAHERNWDYVETRGATPPNHADGTRPPPSVTYLNHRLPLQPDVDAVFHLLHSSTRRAVRKAEKNGLVADVVQDEAGVRAYYGLHCQTRKFHGLPPQSWSFFREIHRQAMAQGQGAVVLVRLGQRPIGGGLFFRFGRVATYKFGASDRDHLHLRPNNLMMWTAMAHFARQGASLFDFGRTSVWNAGLRQFKLHWGTQERELSYHRWKRSPGSFQAKGDPASGWHVQLFRHLPIWASRLAGELLYRHVA